MWPPPKQSSVCTVLKGLLKGIWQIIATQTGLIIATHSQLVENTLDLVPWTKNYITMDKNLLQGVKMNMHEQSRLHICDKSLLPALSDS